MWSTKSIVGYIRGSQIAPNYIRSEPDLAFRGEACRVARDTSTKHRSSSAAGSQHIGETEWMANTHSVSARSPEDSNDRDMTTTRSPQLTSVTFEQEISSDQSSCGTKDNRDSSLLHKQAEPLLLYRRKIQTPPCHRRATSEAGASKSNIDRRRFGSIAQISSSSLTFTPSLAPTNPRQRYVNHCTWEENLAEISALMKKIDTLNVTLSSFNKDWQLLPSTLQHQINFLIDYDAIVESSSRCQRTAIKSITLSVDYIRSCEKAVARHEKLIWELRDELLTARHKLELISNHYYYLSHKRHG